MKRIFLLLILCFTLIPFTSAQENEGLSEGEILLLERVVAGLQTRENYTNYVEDATELDAQRLNYVIDGQTAVIASANQLGRTTTVIRQEDTPPNILSVVRVIHQDEDVDAINAYDVSAEVRLVDENFYVNAILNGVEGDSPVLPRGWAKVESMDELPIYSALNLTSYLSENDTFTNLELLTENAQQVVVETQIGEDGADVDTIGIVFKGEGFINIFKSLNANTDSPLMTAILGNLAETSQVLFTITLDSANNPVRINLDLQLNSTAIDLTTIDAERFTAGSTVQADLRVTSEIFLKEYNSTRLELTTIPINEPAPTTPAGE